MFVHLLEGWYLWRYCFWIQSMSWMFFARDGFLSKHFNFIQRCNHLRLLRCLILNDGVWLRHALRAFNQLIPWMHLLLYSKLFIVIYSCKDSTQLWVWLLLSVTRLLIIEICDVLSFKWRNHVLLVVLNFGLTFNILNLSSSNILR